MNRVRDAISILDKISAISRNTFMYYTVGKFLRMDDNKSATELLQYWYKGKTINEIRSIYEDCYFSLQFHHGDFINLLNTEHKKYNIEKFAIPAHPLLSYGGKQNFFLMLSGHIYGKSNYIIELLKDDPDINLYEVLWCREYDRECVDLELYVLNNYYDKFLKGNEDFHIFLKGKEDFHKIPIEFKKDYVIKLLNNGLKYSSTSFTPYYNDIIDTINMYKNEVNKIFITELTNIIIEYFNYP